MSNSEIIAPTMCGGVDNIYSYYKNSELQRQVTGVFKEKLDEVIAEKLNFNELHFLANTFRLADLGCATGPNTFIHVQQLIEAIKEKRQSQCPEIPPLQFQVFFNDQANNDFNTLFTSLPPNREYFAAGVPGSFNNQIFPDSSLHLVHTANTFHWLSKVPEELMDQSSPAWNRGRVHHGNAPDAVVKAYTSQFAKDKENFFNARARELVSGGMMVIITQGVPQGVASSDIPPSLVPECIGLSLMDMVKEGLISEAQVDSFNFPMYYPYEEEMREVIERNGCFNIERLEFLNTETIWQKGQINIRGLVVQMRSVLEGLVTNHFGRENVDDIFERLSEKLIERSRVLESTMKTKTHLFLVLKRI